MGWATGHLMGPPMARDKSRIHGPPEWLTEHWLRARAAGAGQR